MGLQAHGGDVFVFRNRQKDKVKILTWDRNGFVMGYKRLERGRFDFPSSGPDITISWEEFWMLISGMPILRLGRPDEKENPENPKELFFS